MVYLETEMLFDAFLKEKQFLCGASPATVRIYSKSWLAYKRYVGCTCEITGDRLKSFTAHDLLIDTGARVSEALTLTRKNIDFENLLVTLKGNGNKQRRVPIMYYCFVGRGDERI